MNFSKTSSYAIKVIQYMSRNIDKHLNTKDLHLALNIPHQYLRNIMTSLAKSGYIIGIRGRNGGFILKRPSNEITIAEIIDSIEGLNKIQKCIIGDTDCQFDNYCSLHNYWLTTRTDIISKLKNTTIEEFVI